MLQLKNITKDYKVGDEKVHALKGVSIDFRESEFVSILGQSGCGKTTLLNIIGGLDRYTEGDLIIGGKSTKEFKNADWDTYRNHSIGFVFQSYNLIPHQTVLANVELALTLSGVSKTERRQRAKDALVKVGLGDQLKKKPNQMSGGQMQRVAIARALVNEPDILLADEPTGALDSETSVQIMELLKEISKDKLIIMVTHNPELAEKYSNRIIRLLDGRVVDDTNPYDRNVVEPIEKKKAGKEKKIKKPSMSYFTALSLSLNNLMTKKGRTFMTSFAGSIGIIGIALILSISSGAQLYIKSVEEETLASYPIAIERNAMDMSSMMTSMMKDNTSDGNDDGKVHSNNIMGSMVNTMLTQLKSNDLKSFKTYLENDGKEINDYVSDIKYGYSTPLNIFRNDKDKGIIQVNPATLFEDMGMTNAMYDSQLMSNVVSTSYDTWTELLDNDKLLNEQYKVLAGRMPSAYNEVVVMVNKDNEISDYSLYCMGLMDSEELINAVKSAMSNNNEKVEFTSKLQTYTYDELLGLEFRLVTNPEFYEKENGVWHGTAYGKYLELCKEADGTLVLFNTTEHDFESIWRKYFDLDRDYGAVNKNLSKNEILKSAAEYSFGIRILNQEPWETLCSFIISQNNNIKRIKGIISRLCDNFGEDKGGYHAFPTAERIAECTLEDLEVLRSGFRAKYILDAAQKISSGEIDLEKLKTVSTDAARDELMKIKGVGPKVADCALLFSLCHIDAFPKDVWIKRAMQALFGGELPEEAKPYAGIAQQYIFFYARETKLSV